MKRFGLLLFLWIGFFTLRAQDTTLAGIVPVDASGMITWQDVIPVPDVDRGAMYNKGIEWINSYFPNAARVTKRRSPESGIIDGAHSIRLYDVHDGVKVPSHTITYTFKLEFRDGRFRYTISEFQLRAASRFPLERWLDKDGPFYSPANRQYLEQVRDEIEKMINSMVSFITKPEAPPEEEW
jgi:hypothetical protein